MDYIEKRLRQILSSKGEVTEEECRLLGVPFPLEQEWRQQILAAFRRKANTERQARSEENKSKRKPAKAKKKKLPDPAIKKPRKKVNKKKKIPTNSFYASWEWKEARYKALKAHGRRCMCCGWSPDGGGSGHLVVDHIKPRSKYPKLELEASNLQVLCNNCNMGKSNKHQDDFRPQAPAT